MNQSTHASLILVRHGLSTWNFENRFTGWTDVGLIEKGIEEARRAGRILCQQGYSVNIAYTSMLKRAIHTAWLILTEMDRMWVPLECSWRLNERHYGALQGLNKKETAERHGEEQVHVWRRSYSVRPPALSHDDPRHPRFDPRYAHLDPRVLPASESLFDTLVRCLPAWQDRIALDLRMGRHVLVAAHGNSLRALVKMLDGISDEEIPLVEIPTGVPVVYMFDQDLNVASKIVLD
ncbi:MULTISPECIES: 2,3-diphosphoglycerate-dependent phosphoglycerate mutase [Methylocaldum]|jgi:2,3-bisphosphoglycerate-dependent phosphoglycerate mutase|uniref:2,3-diphosphoglycerate-dependent phosphoglycerate mutase n=1 Tax=Methylocaldum sp. 14B TaxID=1912213 RepID=UPI00098B3DFA|nr:2,3-diphosphoglycerate-dependent phosphoglycerate mutase [Methylocaldum sp. 14B]MVF23158.1 2,3-diphosphoglycerate-dependent phosphoglycerate mutase [Methylocaldum sp. BRCS4]